MKNIRSEYVKSLIADKKALAEKLDETTKDTLKEILSESLNKEISKILTEAEDEFEEEEVEADNTTELEADAEGEAETEDFEEIDTESGEEPLEGGEDSAEEMDAEDGETEDEIWGNLEQFKSEDGEYDLSKLDKDNVLKVLKVMTPEDGIRIVKNDNGTLTLSDDETEKEYIIDIENSLGEGEEAEEVETDYEIEFDDDDELEESVNEQNEFTDNYQNKTAMTTPGNHETASEKDTYSMDNGVPTGTEKPFAGKGNTEPFDKNVNEGEEMEPQTEEEVNEVHTTTQNNPTVRGTGKTYTSNSSHKMPRNGSAEGEYKKGTSQNMYSEAKMAKVMKMANAIHEENKQLRALTEKIKEKLTEAIVINASLGKVIKLVTENTTTRDEKVDIVKRFSNVKTIDEGKALYESVKKELSANPNRKVNMGAQVQLAESRNNAVETPIYQCEDLTETLSLMHRMAKLDGKKKF